MENKEIRFIDSHYNELFRIPDNSSITVTYPDGHTEDKFCKYIDEYHTYIDGVCYHICQWAELMEQNGNVCAPADKPEYTLEPIEQSEFEFMYKKEDESIERGCIGHLRADFDTGKAFFHTWWAENDSLKTPEFKAEFDKVIEYFRKKSSTPLLKSRSDMYNVCYRLRPTAYEGNHEIKGFKVQTDKHTYYLRCNPRLGEYNLYAYCYKTSELEKFKNTRFVEQNFEDVDKDKFFITDNGVTEVYFNPDSTAGGQLVYNEISKDLIAEAAKATSNSTEFFDYLQEKCRQYLMDIDSPEFKGHLDSFMQRKADFEDYSDKTAKALKKLAGVEPEKAPRKKEPER